jgi:hypothetical protein
VDAEQDEGYERKEAIKVRNKISCRLRQIHRGCSMSSPLSAIKSGSAKQVNKDKSLNSPATKSRSDLAICNKVSKPDDFPVRQIDFASLPDGTIIESIEDPADPTRTRFAVFKRRRVRIADRVQDRGRILVPVPRSVAGFSDVKLPTGVMNYRSTTRLALAILKFFEYAIDVPAQYGVVLAAYVLYTWVADRLPVAVYLSVVGLPQSGKSTLLEFLSLLCRRPLLVSDISQAAVYRACSNFGVTLLIDEIEWGSTNAGALRQLLRAGTGRSARALRVRDSSFSFGPKVLGSLESCPDSALMGRCFKVPMTETTKRRLIKPSHPAMLKYAGELQQKLLKFRLNNYESIRAATISGSVELRPRSRDILGSIAAPVTHVPFWGRLLLEMVKAHHDPLTREPLAPRQEAMVAALFHAVHLAPTIASVRVKFLADAANALLHVAHERVTLTDKAAGTMLADLGFTNKQRTNCGWTLWLDSAAQTRIHQLVKTFDNRHMAAADVESCATACAATNSPARIGR